MLALALLAGWLASGGQLVASASASAADCLPSGQICSAACRKPPSGRAARQEACKKRVFASSRKDVSRRSVRRANGFDSCHWATAGANRWPNNKAGACCLSCYEPSTSGARRVSRRFPYLIYGLRFGGTDSRQRRKSGRLQSHLSNRTGEPVRFGSARLGSGELSSGELSSARLSSRLAS